MLIMSSHGFVDVMGFRGELVQSLHLVKNTDEDVEHCVDTVASAVTNECLALAIKRNVYHINIDEELVRESVGNTIPLLFYIYHIDINQIRQRVAGNDVDKEHYNRDRVLPTNIPPSSIRGTQAIPSIH